MQSGATSIIPLHSKDVAPFGRRKKKIRMRRKATIALLLTTLLMLANLLVSAFVTPISAAMPSSPTLDPTSIPKFVSQLVIPPVHVPTVVTHGGTVIRHDYKVDVTEFYQQILPSGFPATKVWGYGSMARDAITGQFLSYFRNAPGSTFEATRGIPIQVTWQNKLTGPNLFPVDPTIHWANPNNMPMMLEPPYPPFPPGFPEAQSPVPLITHLHGGEDQSTSDGYPEAWFTATGVHGDEYNTVKKTSADSAVFYYPNMQQATTLWYHDHALGITRLNVMSGLAGFYLLRDTSDTVAPLLPSGRYEVPIVIQDRSFNLDGSLWFPTEGTNPEIHPYWQPEFFGNTIMVNGVVWPNFNVAQGQYRLRLLDGSNARFYALSFSNERGGFLPFTQIGSDGGYLRNPVAMTELTIAPGERADILINFAGLPAGTKILLRNTAKAPFPSGAPANPLTVGQIMQFTVTGSSGPTPAILPTLLNPTLTSSFPTLPSPSTTRTLTLFEAEGPAGPEMVLLDGQMWHESISELPRVGSTEDWMIVDATADAHPIHVHLVQFQVVSRQSFAVNKYTTDWLALNGEPPLDHPTHNLQLSNYLIGMPRGPDPNEVGWKDTIKVSPGEVTILRMRFAPQNAPTTGPYAPYAGINLYPFDPTVGPGYVWHCHILDHEDNEMMRPYRVTR